MSWIIAKVLAERKIREHALKTTGVHGVNSGYYLAKTARSDQLPSWNDIPDKPPYGTYLKSILELTADEMASLFNAHSDNDLLALVTENVLSDAFAVDVFASANLSASKAADILNSPKLSVSKAISILNGLSADRAQAILYSMADKLYVDKLVQILTNDAPDVTLSAATTYTGVNRFKTLDLGGYVYTADGQPHVIIADTIRDSVGGGAIDKTKTGGAGGAAGQAPGAGGAGGGGLIIICRTFNAVAHADGAPGEDGNRAPTVTAAGAAGGAGSMIRVGTDVPGNGGRGGYWVGGDPGAGGAPGAGGGGGYNSGSSDAGGDGGSITLTTYASYSALAADILKAAIDWWLVNVLGKTPTTTKSFPSCYGAGGGGGGDNSAAGDDCGGGGGSGGWLCIIALDIQGTLTADGGAGGSAGSGGGGGGGGIVYALYKNSCTATLSAAGGAAGSGGYYAPVAGGAGTAKAAAI